MIVDVKMVGEVVAATVVATVVMAAEVVAATAAIAATAAMAAAEADKTKTKLERPTIVRTVGFNIPLNRPRVVSSVRLIPSGIQRAGYGIGRTPDGCVG